VTTGIGPCMSLGIKSCIPVASLRRLYSVHQTQHSLWLSLLLCIWEVTALYLCPQTGYSVWGFSLLSSVQLLPRISARPFPSTALQTHHSLTIPYDAI